MADGGIFTLGMSLASRSTVLPVFVEKLGGGHLSVSLIPVVWYIGLHLPQVLFARTVQQVSPRKPLLLMTGFLQRLPWLLLALFAFFLSRSVSPAAGLVLFFVIFGMASGFGSLNMPVWFELVSKTTPRRLRGRLFAARAILGAVLGIGGGIVVERILRLGAWPNNFGWLFLLAFAAVMVSLLMLVFLREGPIDPPDPVVSLRTYLARIPEILRTRLNFRRYLVGQVLLLTAAMVEGFFIVHAIERFQLAASWAGIFTAIMMGSMIAGALIFGMLADRRGHRLNLIIASAALATACLVAIAATSVWVYALAFVLISLSLGLQSISRLPIVAELSGEQDRPTYVALTNLITTPFVLTGVGIGFIANAYGLVPVFAIAGVVSAAGACWFAFMVREPRTLENKP